MKRLFLDPGHGGYDPGAVNQATGLQEKDVVLDVCQMVQNILSPLSGQVQCILSRNGDLFLPLSKRADAANASKADLFVSVHCNSAVASRAHGMEIFTSRGETPSDSAATTIFKQWGEDFPNRTQRTDYSDSDPDKEAQFTVLTKTRMAAVLLELEFIHNQQGDDFLRPAANRQRMANSIAKGCMTVLGVSQEPVGATEAHPPAVESSRAIIARIQADLAALATRYP